MAKVKEVWVRFSDTETYFEKEGELHSILANASGDCVVKVYIENIRSCKELHDWSFDKEQLSLLTDAFGEENVRYQERENKKEIKWSRPTEVPKIKQLLPCMHDMYAVMRDIAISAKFLCMRYVMMGRFTLYISTMNLEFPH